jgi:hypothetical protein
MKIFGRYRLKKSFTLTLLEFQSYPWKELEVLTVQEPLEIVFRDLDEVFWDAGAGDGDFRMWNRSKPEMRMQEKKNFVWSSF